MTTARRSTTCRGCSAAPSRYSISLYVYVYSSISISHTYLSIYLDIICICIMISNDDREALNDLQGLLYGSLQVFHLSLCICIHIYIYISYLSIYLSRYTIYMYYDLQWRPRGAQRPAGAALRIPPGILSLSISMHIDVYLYLSIYVNRYL